MKSYPEMIAEAEASIDKYDERIASLKKKGRGWDNLDRISRLEDARQCTYYGLQNMLDYLAKHPELNEKEEIHMKKTLDWNAIFSDIDNGLSKADAALKHKCSEVTILNKVRERNRSAKTTETALVAKQMPLPEVPLLIPAAGEALSAIKMMKDHMKTAMDIVDQIIALIAAGNNNEAYFVLGRQYGYLETAIERASAIIAIHSEP
jgi:hypothetical protein